MTRKIERVTASGPTQLPGVTAALTRLLRPRSIAIVGASERAGSFGQRLLANVTGGRYEGAVYPVNPRYATLAGQTCYGSLADLPETPDLVAFAVSDDVIEAALTEAAQAGVRAAALFGRAYEPARPGAPSKAERLSAIARSAGMAVCGNNCMGFVNLIDGLKVSGNPPPIPDHGGNVGLISHSGSTWSGLVGNQRQLVFNYAISAGQEIATTMADYMRFLLDQPETRVIGCILETVRAPDDFIAALEQADRRGIPIVALKLGRSARGRAFALAHSGALAGSDAAYGAIFARHNVVRVFTPDELTDTLEIFASSRQPPAPGVGVVTDSGGERELITDIASDLDAPLTDLSPATRGRLAVILDPGMSTDNPVDSYGDGRTLLAECLAVLAEDAGVGTVALATNMVHGRPYLYAATAAVERTYGLTDKPVVIFGNLHSTISREEAQRLRALGIPVLMGTASALTALKLFGAWHQRRRAEGAGARAAPQASAPPGRLELAAILARAEQALSPVDSIAILEAFGLPFAPSRFANTREEAVRAAGALGFPVALKTADPRVLHKTELGAVVVGLADEPALACAYSELTARLGPYVQVQAMAGPGVELILGMTNEPPFGPMMTVGLGGVLTEVLGDVVTVQPPVSGQAASRLLRRLKGFRLLEGYRGRPPTDLEALCGFIERFSALCASIGASFSAIDLNPVIATPSGVVAVDALMIPSTKSAQD